MIELKGEHHLIGGIVFGGLAGAAVGAMTLWAEGTGLDGWTTGCLIGGGIGMLIGGIIGGNNTVYDEVVYKYADADEYDFTHLNIYSRYRGEEPDYLKGIK